MILFKTRAAMNDAAKKAAKPDPAQEAKLAKLAQILQSGEFQNAEISPQQRAMIRAQALRHGARGSR